MPRAFPLLVLIAGMSLLRGTASGAETAASSAGKGVECQEPIELRHTLDNEPIELSLRPDQEITPAVEEFHCTGKNPYRGDESTIADGKKIYSNLCKACHLEDGTGRIGPNLVDDQWAYPRTSTDKGKFEIIYAGGAGAMQAFGRRIDQDDILKVMAYLEVLGKR